MHDRPVEHDSGADEPLVDAAEGRDDRFFCALISDIYDDRVHRLQLQLGLDQFLQGAAGNRDFRAFVLDRDWLRERSRAATRGQYIDAR